MFAYIYIHIHIYAYNYITSVFRICQDHRIIGCVPGPHFSLICLVGIMATIWESGHTWDKPCTLWLTFTELWNITMLFMGKLTISTEPSSIANC